MRRSKKTRPETIGLLGQFLANCHRIERQQYTTLPSSVEHEDGIATGGALL